LKLLKILFDEFKANLRNFRESSSVKIACSNYRMFLPLEFCKVFFAELFLADMRFLKFYTFDAISKDFLLAGIDKLEMDRHDLSGNLNEATLIKVDAAIRNAKNLALENKYELGWNQVFLGELQLIKFMTPQQQMIKAQNLRIEAKEISGIYQAQIYALIGSPEEMMEKPSPDFSADKVIEATRIRFDYYGARNHRIRLWRASLEKVSISLVIFMLAIITFNFFVSIIDAFKEGGLAFQVIYAVLLGMLGASLSKAHSIARIPIGMKTPEILAGNFITFIHLAIGATSAFIMLMLLKSHFLNSLFPEKVLTSPYIYIVISFLSGFSERWVVGILESATKREEKKNN
jgi:hypothetical protein